MTLIHAPTCTLWGGDLDGLLQGLQPFDTKQQQEFPLDELLRKLRLEEPPTPSTRVGGNRINSRWTAEARSTEPRQLVKNTARRSRLDHDEGS